MKNKAISLNRAGTSRASFPHTQPTLEHGIYAMLRISLTLISFAGLAFVTTPSARAAQEAGASKAVAHTEIQGVVLELGTQLPVAQVEVTLIRLAAQGPRIIGAGGPRDVAAKGLTDDQGAFRFTPNTFGDYRVEVRKEGWSAAGPAGRGGATSMSVSLNEEHAARTIRFLLARPGELIGQVVDEETRRPIANVRVNCSQAVYLQGRRRLIPGGQATTDEEGRFVARGLTPGAYVVEIAPKTSGRARALTDFSPKDEEAIDRDFGRTYWPGGRDLDSALPVPLASGGSMDVGPLPVRKVSHYRVRVLVAGPGCDAGQKETLFQLTKQGPFSSEEDMGEFPCGAGVLIRGFAPGSYEIHAIANAKDPANRTYGVAPLDVVDKNLNVTVSVARGVDVGGRIETAEGARRPPLERVRVMMRPVDATPFADAAPIPPDAQGRFTVVNVQASRQLLAIVGIAGGNYVKEVRYNGAVVRDNVVVLNQLAMAHELAIVIDDKPASLTGTVRDGDKPVSAAQVILASWPRSPEAVYARVPSVTGDEAGKFQFGDLPPGEYRLLAVSSTAKDKLEEPGVLDRLLSGATKVTLAANGSQNVELELLDPFH